MRYEKPVPFPLLMLQALKDKLSRKSIRLDVNRGWLVKTYIKYAYKNMTDEEIIALAEKDKDSVPHRKFKQ